MVRPVLMVSIESSSSKIGSCVRDIRRICEVFRFYPRSVMQHRMNVFFFFLKNPPPPKISPLPLPAAFPFYFGTRPSPLARPGRGHLPRRRLPRRRELRQRNRAVSVFPGRRPPPPPPPPPSKPPLALAPP